MEEAELILPVLPPSFPSYIVLKTKQNYYIVCVHMHLYVLVHICGISEDSLQK